MLQSFESVFGFTLITKIGFVECNKAKSSSFRVECVSETDHCNFKTVFTRERKLDRNWMYSHSYKVQKRAPFHFPCVHVSRPFQDNFSSYETGQSVGGRKRENPGKNHLAHPQAELGLSHMLVFSDLNIFYQNY